MKAQSRMPLTHLHWSKSKQKYHHMKPNLYDNTRNLNRKVVLWVHIMHQNAAKGKRVLPMTTGANESHKVMGMDCPKINWEAAALKNGSRAEKWINKIFMKTTKSRNVIWFISKFGSLPLIVWVNETATAANETLLVTWPSAWQKATGISNFRRVESIGCKPKHMLAITCVK